MPTTTLLRTIASIPDMRAVLSNSTPSRSPSVALGTWNKLRIAARFCCRDLGVNLTGTPRFALGLCHGQANTFGSPLTDNFVGVVSSGTTWTRQTGPPIHYSGVNLQACTRVGASLIVNSSAINSGGSYVFAQPADGKRQMFFVDIEKGSPNYNVNAFYRNSNADDDVSEDEFLFYAQLASPSRTGFTMGTQRTIAASEGTGVWDNINAAWNFASPQIELSDVCVVKLS